MRAWMWPNKGSKIELCCRNKDSAKVYFVAGCLWLSHSTSVSLNFPIRKAETVIATLRTGECAEMLYMEGQVSRQEDRRCYLHT